MPSQICALCGKTASLRLSHIIPKFVFTWLKDTSATGFLRRAVEPDKREQDGDKVELLCHECEQLFSSHERSFANSIFYPYVQTELSNEGIAQGKIKEIQYDEWLLRFCISLQWRSITYIRQNDDSAKSKLSQLTPEQIEVLDRSLPIWADYLLGKRNDTGPGEHHIIFLQSLASAKGAFPSRISDRTNTYLLRTTDTTFTFSTGPKKTLSMYSKIGPIVFWSYLRPATSKNMSTSRIHKRGRLNLKQSLGDTDLTEFVFVDRPHEAAPREMSEQQNQKIAATIRKNPERAARSMTIEARLADEILKAKKQQS